MMKHVFLLLLIAVLHQTAALNTVLYGPAARELLLLTAKLAAREGLETSCICAPDTEKACQRLMYGDNYLAGETEEISSVNCARPVSSGEDIQSALEATDSIIFVAHDTPIDEKSYNTLIDSAGENLSKIVLLSKMGVSKAKGGFFGGGDAKLLESERTLRDIATRKNLDLSIVRAGNLKGGGPGEDGNDFGLDGCYYNTLLDVVEASVTMAHDKWTLGLDCQSGDRDMPNAFSQMGTKSSFEACEYETNRIVAAGGVVAAIFNENPVEVCLGAEKATRPPTREEWNEALSKIPAMA